MIRSLMNDHLREIREMRTAKGRDNIVKLLFNNILSAGHFVALWALGLYILYIKVTSLLFPVIMWLIIASLPGLVQTARSLIDD